MRLSAAGTVLCSVTLISELFSGVICWPEKKCTLRCLKIHSGQLVIKLSSGISWSAARVKVVPESLSLKHFAALSSPCSPELRDTCHAGGVKLCSASQWVWFIMCMVSFWSCIITKFLTSSFFFSASALMFAVDLAAPWGALSSVVAIILLKRECLILIKSLHIDLAAGFFNLVISFFLCFLFCAAEVDKAASADWVIAAAAVAHQVQCDGGSANAGKLLSDIDVKSYLSDESVLFISFPSLLSWAAAKSLCKLKDVLKHIAESYLHKL